MTFSDYSYITLAVTGADNRTLQKFGDISFLRRLTNPSAMFLNAPEVYAFVKQNDIHQITLWREGYTTVSVGIADGADVNPEAVLKLLRSASHVCASPEKLFADAGLERTVTYSPGNGDVHPNATRIPKAKVIYLSTAEIVSLIASYLRTPEPEWGELLAVQATAVAVGDGAFIPTVTVTNVGLYDFDVTPAPAEVKAKKQRKLTLQEIEDEIEAENERVGDSRRRPSKRVRGAWVFVLLAILALGAGWAAVKYLPSLIPSSTPYDGMENSVVSVDATDISDVALPEVLADTVSSEINDTLVPLNQIEEVVQTEIDTVPTETIINEVVPAEKGLEDEDVAYLNSQTVWKRAALKSKKYQDFFDLLSAGDIKAIAETDYFAQTGVATNRTAIKMIDMLWQAYKSPTQRSNELQLKKLKGKSEIDITKLYDNLSRYRDANPNKSPRPKK